MLTEQQLEFFYYTVRQKRELHMLQVSEFRIFAGFEAVFKRELEKFSAISVREESGQKMVGVS